MTDAEKEIIKKHLDIVDNNIKDIDALKYSIEKLIEHYFSRQKYSLKAVMNIHTFLKSLIVKIEGD